MTQEIPDEAMSAKDLQDALLKLQQGEQTATRLEKMLDGLEDSIEQMLKEAEAITAAAADDEDEDDDDTAIGADADATTKE
jgi:Skp family chaperone for outer membrane proteins